MLNFIAKSYSPNFEKLKRSKNKIKFIIIHYTGMKSEKDALNRLTNIQSGVSAHYFVKSSGLIIQLVPENYIAWHAGQSFWKGKKSLNNYSIGIELCNPGHQHGYKKFRFEQIKSLIILLRKLIKKYKIKKKNILGHSDIAPERKKDPGEKFPWEYLSKKKVSIWYNLNKNKIKKLRKKKCSKFDEINFLKNLNRIGYKTNNRFLALKAFQRRFRPKLVDGKIDQECLKISDFIAKI